MQTVHYWELCCLNKNTGQQAEQEKAYMQLQVSKKEEGKPLDKLTGLVRDRMASTILRGIFSWEMENL